MDEDLIAAGLYEPGVDDPSRAALVRRCLEIGLSADEIREAGDDLIDRAVLRIHYGDVARLTTQEVAERAQVPASRVELIARASGRLTGPDTGERVFDEEDVQTMATIGAAFDLLGEESVLQMVRVATAAVARIGDALISAFLTGVAAPAMRDDESGLRLIEANVTGAALLPEFGHTLTQLLRRHLQQSYRTSSDVAFEAALAHGVDTRVMAIGFADLVGSTTLADRTSLAGLNASLDTFERLASDVVVGHGGRVVKFIGDEVMFRADTADVAGAIALELIEAAGDDRVLPPLRIGLAHGEVLSREGDFYGPTVNLASRATRLAPPDGIIATRALVDALGSSPRVAIESLGTIEMRGLTEPVELFALAAPTAERD